MQVVNGPNITDGYRDSEHQDESKLERFTIFVRFRYGDGVGEYSIEEIDVDALNRKHASAIAKQALADDYEEGGVIAKISHRPRGFMYL